MREKIITPLTSLRGIAAVAVTGYHLFWMWAGVTFFSRAYLGVDFFFLLSGFVLAHVYQEGVSLRSFFIARVARTYPLHLFMLVLFLPAFGKGPSYETFPLLCNLAMTQVICGVGSWNPPSWSLSAEWFAYLLFPFALAPVQRCPPWLAVTALVCCVAVMAASAEHLSATFGILALCRSMPEFLIGMIAYRAFQARWMTHPAWLAAAVLAMGFTSWLGGRDIFLVLEMAVAIVACSSFRPLEWRPLVFLGEISYSLYMVHVLVGAASAPMAGLVGIRNASVVATLASILSITFATLTYRYIELPARTKLRIWLDRPTPDGVLLRDLMAR
jgi:peptidoglycan/LPS O-acetylase OafA/YrhL